MTGHVETVCGPVDPAQLGSTLMHEHLLALQPGRWMSGGRQDDRVEAAERALDRLPELGVRSVVDLTTIEGSSASGRDVTALRVISERTGLHVVAASAFYKDPYYPGWVVQADIDELAEFHRREARAGIDGSKAKAGIYGEVGSSLHRITPNEEKAFRAIARAHRDTGLAISTHCTLGTMALEQIAILAEEGADLERVIIGHLDLSPDPIYLEAVLSSGVTIGFDTIGKEWFDYRVPDSEGEGEGSYVKWAYHRPDERRLYALAWLVQHGYTGQVILSLDLTGYETYLNHSTIGTWGYSYLQDVFLPALRERGVSDDAIHRMTVENPERILTIDV
ncbi:MAG TPA: aryldialkylphosphatase [Chloroflexota bacterium]